MSRTLHRLVALLVAFAVTSVAEAEIRYLPLMVRSPAREEAQQFLRQICDKTIVPALNGFMGCSVCPSFTTMGTTSAPRNSEVWTVTALRHGHFTVRSAEQVLVGTTGCEPHANYFGGSALFQRVSGTWEFLFYEPGLITDECLTVQDRDKRDLLACLDHYSAQSTVGAWLYVPDLSSRNPVKQTKLVDLTDNFDTCGESLVGNTRAPVQSARFHLVYMDTATASLHVEVEYGWRRLTEIEFQQCLKGSQSLGTRDSLAPVTGIYRLLFHFDGKGFRLDTASETVKRIVETVHE